MYRRGSFHHEDDTPTGKRGDVENFLYSVEQEQEDLSQTLQQQLQTHPDLSSERTTLLKDINKKVNEYHDILENLKTENRRSSIPINQLQEELKQAHEYFDYVRSNEMPRITSGGVA